MKRKITIIEVIVIAFIAFLLCTLFLYGAAGGCQAPYGKQLELVSQEYDGLFYKKHWKDKNTGQCFYTIGDRMQLFPEDCK